MSYILKFVLSVVILLVSMIIGGAIYSASHGLGPIVEFVILMPALVAIWAVWRYNPKKGNDITADNENLKKD